MEARRDPHQRAGRRSPRTNITLEEAVDEARSQGIGELGEVRWAVLETSGKITFVKA